MMVEEIRNYQVPLPVRIMDELKKKTGKPNAKEALAEAVSEYLKDE